MIKLYKNLFISYIILAFLPIVLLVLFKIQAPFYMSIIWFIYLLVIIYIFNIVAGKKFNKTIIKMSNDCIIEDYIKEMTNLYSKAINEKLKMIIAISLSTGYFYKNDNKKALKLLESFEPKFSTNKNEIVWKTIYYNNIAVFNLELGNQIKTKETLEIMKEFAKEISIPKESKKYIEEQIEFIENNLLLKNNSSKKDLKLLEKFYISKINEDTSKLNNVMFNYKLSEIYKELNE